MADIDDISGSRMRRKLRANDQLRWLETHNAKAFPVLKQRDDDAQKMKLLLHGLKHAENPRDELNTNVLFASAEPYEVEQGNSDGLWSCNSSLNSYSRLFAEAKDTDPAVSSKQDLAHGHNLQQVMGVITGDMNERQKAGMNPSTLLTEHRRKVLFDALLGTNEVSAEPHSVKKTKLSLYLNNKHPKLMTYSNTQLLVPPGARQESIGSRLDREAQSRSRTLSLSQDDGNTQTTDDSSYDPFKYATMIGQTTTHHHGHGHGHTHSDSVRRASSTASSLTELPPGTSTATLKKSATSGGRNGPAAPATSAAGPPGSSSKGSSNGQSATGGGYDDPEKGKFKARWENYDIMKHRWGYIRPQTHDLCGDDQLVVPSGYTNSAVLSAENSNMYSEKNLGGTGGGGVETAGTGTGESVVLNGRVLDFKQYARVTARGSIKNQRVGSSSSSLQHQKEMRAYQELNRPYQVQHQHEIPVSRSDVRSAQTSFRTMTPMKYVDYHPSQSGSLVTGSETLPAGAYRATHAASLSTSITAPVIKVARVTAPKGSKLDTIQAKYTPQSSLALSRSSGTISVSTYTRECNFPSRVKVSVPDPGPVVAPRQQQGKSRKDGHDEGHGEGRELVGRGELRRGNEGVRR